MQNFLGNGNLKHSGARDREVAHRFIFGCGNKDLARYLWATAIQRPYKADRVVGEL